MSISVPPPEFSFSGLFYNPEWWISTSSTNTLTQALANTLYLRKTTTDSASALETFNAGIKSSGYDTITAGATQNMFSTQTANTNLFPNMGSGQTLKLGNQTTSQSIHVSNIDCNGNSINNANTPTNGTISIGSSQTGSSGILNLGTNVSRTGNINIGGLGSSGKISFNRPLSVAYTTLPVDGDLGDSQTVGSTTTYVTSGTTGTVTNALILTNQPIGIFIYEIRLVTATICVYDSSISTNSATFNAGFRLTENITTAVATYKKNMQVVASTSVQTYYVMLSSTTASVPFSNITVIRTRIG